VNNKIPERKKYKHISVMGMAISKKKRIAKKKTHCISTVALRVIHS
jgi:hypothetical protein